MFKPNLFALAIALASACALAAPQPAGGLVITKQWTYAHAQSGVPGQTSEIAAYDRQTATLWVVGLQGVDVLDAASGRLLRHISTAAQGEANSIAISRGVAAIAIAAPVKTEPGLVRFIGTAAFDERGIAGVGPQPDMLTFTPDGQRLLVANEGEPLNGVDAPGSVSVIDLKARRVTTVPLAGVPITGPGVRVFDGSQGGSAQDFEPEYIAISPEGHTAWITLQEANAIATLDLRTLQFTGVRGLGYQDHQRAAMDPSDKDGRSEQRPVPVLGLFQPDAVAAYEAGGHTYLVMANEGDARADAADEARGAALGFGGELDRLTLSSLDSDAASGRAVAFGARSFSIRDAAAHLVWDSGSQLGNIALAHGLYDDGRSDNKGVEPEGVALLQAQGRTLAFVGLERTTQSAVAIYDVTTPSAPVYVDLIVSEGDIAPEGLTVFRRGGNAYLAVMNEASATTSVFQIARAPR